MATNGSSAGWWAFLGAIGTAAIGSLLRIVPKWRKETHDNDASLEEIRNKGFLEILADYKQQVKVLRERYEALEREHEKVLEEVGQLRVQLATLQARMDAE